MLIRASVALSDNIDHVTTPVSSHFLICGEAAALVDTGPAFVHQQLTADVLKYLEDIALLRFVLLTSAEFDHIGGLPYLRKLKPNIEVIASPKSAELIADVEYLRSAYEQNLLLASAVNNCSLEMTFDEWRELLVVNRMVSEGDTIDLGLEVDVRVFDCPGYRSDSRGYYIRPDSALVAGAALGAFYGRGRVVPSFSNSFNQTVSTIDKLSSLDLKFIGLPYSGVLAGDLARRFLTDVRNEAESFAQSTKEKLSQGILIDEIVDEITAHWTTDGYSPAGPYVSAQKQLVRSMIKAVAEGR